MLDPVSRIPDFDDELKTENTRIAYPLNFIANASATGRAGHPKAIIMLTCDAFGVLPPIAKLDAAQAMYHFLSGYTAKVAGTEKGVTEPQATFSTCFGAPFLPLHPTVYGNLLRDMVGRHDVDCWLVNTGWTGGKFGAGRRMPIRVTRRLVSAALDGSLNRADFHTDPYFGLAAPSHVPGVEPHILEPIKTWRNKAEFAEVAGRARENVPRQFQALRDPRRRARPRRRPNAAHQARVRERPGRIRARDPTPVMASRRRSHSCGTAGEARLGRGARCSPPQRPGFGERLGI